MNPTRILVTSLEQKEFVPKPDGYYGIKEIRRKATREQRQKWREAFIDKVRLGLKNCSVCGQLLTLENCRAWGDNAKCRSCWNAKNRERYWLHGYKQKRAESSRRDQQRLKSEIISHYSSGTMRCKECGIQDIIVLSIDHISGGGRKHRRKIGKAWSGLYRWLRKNNYPPGFQVLCMNCQFRKRVLNGECRESIVR